MKNISLDINSGRYLLAVSGGPDSMALLDIAKNNRLYIEVAHINYHKRDSAKNDEVLVKRYCKNNKIKFHLLNVYPKDVKGNFQSYARNVRYEYFNKLCKKHKLEGVLVAHHLDDHLETYLMQMDKNIGVTYYGLSKCSLIKGILVYRPLLKYEKNDLVKYCETNNIEYGIDDSNLLDIYTRNKIRHQVIEKMSIKDKRQLAKTIDLKNKEKAKQDKYVERYLKKNTYLVDEFLNLKYLNTYLRKLYPNKSDKHFEEMIKQIKNSKQYVYIENDICLVKEYGMINMFKVPSDYKYTFKSIDELNNKTYKYFKIRKKGTSFEAVTLTKKDFPITIRNYKQNDHIKMKYGTKGINRFFIDNKINLFDRMIWPIMFNSKGSAILVPKLGCDVNHYSKKPNVFMIKL